MDKIGLTFDGVKTNEFADMPSVTRPFRKEEQMMLQAYVEKGYQTFITRCADGRKTSKDSIDAIGQGRVWSGQNALGIHLVDELGGINRAIEVAKEKANLKNYRLVELPRITSYNVCYTKLLRNRYPLVAPRSGSRAPHGC